MARRLASLQQTADYLGVTTKTVRRMIASGAITGYRVGNHLIRVDLNEVDDRLCQPVPSAQAAGK